MNLHRLEKCLAVGSETYLVCSIMPLPNAVVLEEISRQGMRPTVAPVNPYTLLALICIQIFIYIRFLRKSAKMVLCECHFLARCIQRCQSILEKLAPAL